MRLVLLSFLGAMIASAERLSADRSPPARCSLSAFATTRDTAVTYLVARGTGDTVNAGLGNVPIPPSSQLGHAAAVFGQIFRVDSIGGSGADAVRRALGAKDTSGVIIVPWGYNPACATDFWSGSSRWVTPDSAGFFSLRLRAESLWVNRRPTFDAMLASVYSYADGPYTAGPRSTFRGIRNLDPSQPPMSAAEVFGLYLALPTLDEARAHDPAAFSRFQAWDQANPSARHRFPGAIILAGWR